MTAATWWASNVGALDAAYAAGRLFGARHEHFRNSIDGPVGDAIIVESDEPDELDRWARDLAEHGFLIYRAARRVTAF